MLTWWRALVALIAVTTGTLPSNGQEFIRLSESEQAYAVAASQLLDMLWVDKKLVLTREGVGFAQQYETRFASFVSRKASDRVDAAISQEFVAENAKLLPDTITPDLPLSSGARLSLIASIVDAAPQLSESGVEANPDALFKALPFALYATLGAAQEEAKAAKKVAIDATSVKRAGIWFFSMGWPFCCAVSPQ